MRILAASVDYYPMTGGVATYTNALCQALSAHSCSVRLIAPNSCSAPTDTNADYSVFIDRFSRENCSAGPVWDSKERSRTTQLIEQQIAEFNPDRLLAFHLHYYGQAMVEVAAKYCLKSSLIIHGLEITKPTVEANFLQDALHRFRTRQTTMRTETRKTLQRADEILVNSTATALRVKSVSGRFDAKVIGAGGPSMEVNKTYEEHRNGLYEAKKSLGIDPSMHVIGTVSRIVKHKNISIIIKMLSNVADTQAIIVGEGPEKTNLQRLANDLGLQNRILFSGQISENDKIKHLLAMDCFCLASLETKNGSYEGFGIALLEANALGIPVIAARSGGMTDIVKDGRTGRNFDPKSVDDLAAVFEETLKNQSAASQQVRSLQAFVQYKFTWRRIAARLLNDWSR